MTHRNLVKLAYQRQLVGAGLGVLSGGGLGYLGASRGKEEDDRAFGARRLRNTLIGAAVGGGLGAGVGHYTRPTPTVITPHTPAPSAERAITAPAVPPKPAGPLPEGAPRVLLSPPAAEAPAPALIATQPAKAAPAAAAAPARAAAPAAAPAAAKAPAAALTPTEELAKVRQHLREMREYEAENGFSMPNQFLPRGDNPGGSEWEAAAKRAKELEAIIAAEARAAAAEARAAGAPTPAILATQTGERAKAAPAAAAVAPKPTMVATGVGEQGLAADVARSQRPPTPDEPKPERGLERYREMMAQREERYRAPTPSAVGTAAAERPARSGALLRRTNRNRGAVGRANPAAETPAAAELKPQLIASDLGRVESPAAQLSAAAAPAAKAPVPAATETAAAKGKRRPSAEDIERMRNTPAAVAKRSRRAELRRGSVEKPRYTTVRDSGDYADIEHAISSPYDNNHYRDGLSARMNTAVGAYREIEGEIADALGVSRRALGVGLEEEFNDPKRYTEVFEQLQRAYPTEYARAVAQIEDPLRRGFMRHHGFGLSEEAVATGRRINSRANALSRTGEMGGEELERRAADGSLSNMERLAATLRLGKRKANAEHHNLLAKDDYGALLESAKGGNTFSAKAEEALVGDTLKKVRERLYPNGFVPREGPRDIGHNRVLYLRGGVSRGDQSAAVRQRHTDPVGAAFAAMRNDHPEEFAKLLAHSGEGELTQMERSLLQHYGVLDRAPAAATPKPSIVGTAVGNRPQPGAGVAAAPSEPARNVGDVVKFDGQRDLLPRGYRGDGSADSIRVALAEDVRGLNSQQLEDQLTNLRYGPENRRAASEELARRRAVEEAELEARIAAGDSIFG